MCDTGETVDEFAEANDLICAGNHGLYIGIDRVELVEDYDYYSESINYGNKNDWDKFVAELTVDDIDLRNKLDNLDNNFSLTDSVIKSALNHEKEIYRYIKSNIDRYKDDILFEFDKLCKWYGEDDEYCNLVNALYNTDIVYSDAITDVLS